MKKIVFLLLMIFIIGISKAGSEVVIIGGYGSTTDELKFMEEKFSAVVIVPKKFMPPGNAVSSLYGQFMEKKISGPIIIIAHSWGGLLARELVARYPEIEIKKIIQIATPNNGHWITPWFLYKVSNSKNDIPLFIIAGNKGAKKWYLKDASDSNDGVVDVSSVLAVEKAEEVKVFHLNHMELIHDDLVVDQIRLWIAKNL